MDELGHPFFQQSCTNLKQKLPHALYELHQLSQNTPPTTPHPHCIVHWSWHAFSAWKCKKTDETHHFDIIITTMGDAVLDGSVRQIIYKDLGGWNNYFF